MFETTHTDHFDSSDSDDWYDAVEWSDSSESDSSGCSECDSGDSSFSDSHDCDTVPFHHCSSSSSEGNLSMSTLPSASNPSFSSHECYSSDSSSSLSIFGLALTAEFDDTCLLDRGSRSCDDLSSLMSHTLRQSPLNMLAARSAAQIPHGICGRDRNGNTLLHLAARADDAETVGLALARGAKPMTRNHDCMTALHEASSVGALRVMRVLLGLKEVREHAGVGDPVADFGPVFYAVLSKQSDAVRMLADCMKVELSAAAYRHDMAFLVNCAQNSEEDNVAMLSLLRELGGLPSHVGLSMHVAENILYITNWIVELGTNLGIA